jgi:hypothetical protein
MQIFWRINSLFDKNFNSMLYFNRLVNTVVESLLKLGQMTEYDTTNCQCLRAVYPFATSVRPFKCIWVTHTDNQRYNTSYLVGRSSR